MMQVVKKRYEFRVVIHEGNDEFWESIQNKAGCDEVTEVVRDALEGSGFRLGDDLELMLVKFSNG